MKVRLTLLFIIMLSAITGYSQNYHDGLEFTRQDTLRGSITPERAWWDLLHYHLNVEVVPQTKTITGYNIITYKVVGDQNRMQIDLQPPMKITKVMQDGKELEIAHEGNAHFITTNDLKIDEIGKVTVHFEGIPKEAVRPPWDGGITWNEDSNGKPFIASSNQGIGASIWWPNKDHPTDEPDNGVLISVEVPEELMDVSNGRLIKTDHNKKKKTKTYHWEVKNPINNYGVNINIGDYVHFGERYDGENGKLDMDYYVLRENLDKAKVHFKDAIRTMQALEHWFGPYPFYEDSYKLVEAPYLGMEHQSSVTYGNGYQNGYRGSDLSKTGWGLKWDFIIIHESGHEWFANNITNKDVADMWLHEGFTAYSENLFLDYHYGKEASAEYVKGTRMNIMNNTPIIGVYGVNREGSSDMYYKGANLLHTVRHIIDNDDKWRSILRGLNKDFYHQTVTSRQVEEYISKNAGINLSKVFDQYLRDIRVPILEYEIKNGALLYRWINCVNGFDMPVKVLIGDKYEWLKPNRGWQKMDVSEAVTEISIHTNFYAGIIRVGI